MKIVHRVCYDVKQHPRAKTQFHGLGVNVIEKGDLKLGLYNYFDISEDHPNWKEVKSILHEEGLDPTSTTTQFTKKEITSAKWVQFVPDNMCGYPMPDLDFGYKAVSFAPDSECPTCGSGKEQIAPIHLKGEPKLGRKQFMAIYWVYKYFAIPEVFDILNDEGITGFEAFPCLHYKSLDELKSVKQIKVTSVLPPALISDNLVRDWSTCDHVKHNAIQRGMTKFTEQVLDGQPDVIYTNEWFGSGHQAFRLILASSRFVKVFMDNKWKGLSFAPIELV